MVKTKPNKTMQLAKDAMDELISAVEAGKSDQLKRYLSMMARFHRYSLGNVMLVAMQRPDATRVAGYRTWQRLGRQVRQGERAIQILAPIFRRRKDEEEEEEKVVAFKTAAVFDVNQTDGAPLVEFARATGDPGAYIERLKQFVASRNIELQYSDMIGGAEGLSTKGKILLRKGLAPAEEFSVLVHETAHAFLHTGLLSHNNDKTLEETEAEAVAFIVSQAIGLDSRSASADYIALYRGDKETLMQSLEQIQQTASQIIEGITANTPTTEKEPSPPAGRADGRWF